MMTDIEIAQSVEMRPILEIAANAGIPTEDLEQLTTVQAVVNYLKEKGIEV